MNRGETETLESMGPRWVLGIMSGTSIDGVDYALCRIGRSGIQLSRHWRLPFPASLRARLHEAAAGAAGCHEVARLHHDLGRFYAAGAQACDHRRRLDLVGLHGQTVFHQPGRPHPATLQIGEPAWLAEALGVPVVSNFRAADLAAGGEGAPLATLFHVEVFGRSGEFVCVQNLGGISNVTAIDGRRGAARVLAFDTGPANVLLDLAMRRLTDGRRLMDGEGAWASRGTADERLLAEWLQHPFLRRRPPKSTGRELFGESFWVQAFKQAQEAAVSRFGLLATLAEFTARSITLNYQWHLGGVPDRVVLTGGGAANPDLVARITRELRTWEPGIHVCDSQDLGWPRQAIEPAAFALLAYRRMAGLPGNLPKTTGARRPVLLGQVTEV